MNNKSSSRFISLASLLAALAVGFGAFGAHVLRGSLGLYELQIFERATFYHFIHALGILLVVSLAANKLVEERLSTKVCNCFLYGTFIFSGSLYLLALTGVKLLGAITPIGGILFIVGWVLLFRAAARS